MEQLLPKTRGEYLCNIAMNIPTRIPRNKAFRLVPINAAVAWKYCGGPEKKRFSWQDDVLGPRAMLLHVSNGPNFFAHKWIHLVFVQIMSKSHLFFYFPHDVLRHIIWFAFDCILKNSVINININKCFSLK